MMTQLPITQTSVTYSQSRKINLGNYEAVDIFLSSTYVAAGQDAQELYGKAVEFVESRLDEKEDELRKTSTNVIAKNKVSPTAEEKETPKTAKKSEPAKKAEKPAKETKAASEPVDEEVELTIETVKEALREYSVKYKKEAAKQVIVSVTGSDKMASIKEEHLADMMIALEKAPA